MIWWCALLLFVHSLSHSLADNQDPFAEEVLAVKAQRIETVSQGVIENGVIVIRNGKIAAVGKDAKIPVGAKIIEAQTVMPGIVGVYSQIGLSAGAAPTAPPVGGQFGGRFGGFGGVEGGAASNPHFRVLDELYPFHDDYERLLKAGVTTLALVPSGRGINGQGAIIRLSGASAEKMAIASNAPLALNFAANTQTQNMIRLAFDGARGGGGPSARSSGAGGASAFDDFDADDDFAIQRRQPPGRPPFARSPASTGSLEARREPMARAVNGDIPTFINCSDAAATLYALKLFQPYDKLKPVFVLTSDCYRVAEQLGQKKASVVLSADLAFEPNTRNRLNVPAILAKAGVKIACRPPTDNVEGYESLLFKMGELVKSGLDRDTALKAITLHPAEMLNVSQRVGSIEVGRDGNLILLDGDPLATMTKVQRVVLEGKVAYE
jgi:hypothetical protein